MGRDKELGRALLSKVSHAKDFDDFYFRDKRKLLKYFKQEDDVIQFMLGKDLFGCSEVQTGVGLCKCTETTLTEKATAVKVDGSLRVSVRDESRLRIFWR